MMLSYFRRSDVDDGKIYLDGVASVLSSFSREVVDYVTGISTGMAARQVFAPSASEVRKACDEHAAHIARIHERGAREARQIAARAEDAAKPCLTREELLARHGPNYGITKAPEEEITAAKAKRREYLTRGNKFCFDQEYRQAGLEPPADGLSLALRLSMGWRIEQDQQGKSVLVAPQGEEVR